MSDKIDTDVILNSLQECVEKGKAQFDAHFWIGTAMKLNLLLGTEQDILWNAKQEVAKMKLDIFNKQEKRNVAAANLEIETSEVYKKMRIQEDKVGRVEEFVRISKKMSDIASGY